MMTRRNILAAAASALTAACSAPTRMNESPADAADPFLWLEDVEAPQALDWVRRNNAASQSQLAQQPAFARDEQQILGILNSRDRIPYVRRIGAHVYNLWTDEEHPRGLWRRTTLDDYRRAQPAWETVIDVDALGRADKVSWVWHGAVEEPARSVAGMQRCLVNLSRGGSDAHVVREFDLAERRFVPGGIELPEAKSDIAWIDRDTFYVATDFGPGSMTDSGYPRIVKRWRRGTPLAAAQTVFEGKTSDVEVRATVEYLPGGRQRHLFFRAIDFYRDEAFVLQDGKLVRIDKPDDAQLTVQGDLLLLQLRSDWTTGGTKFPAGSLLAAPWSRFMAGERVFDALFTPTATRSLERGGVALTRSHVLLNVLDNVTGSIEQIERSRGSASRRALDLPGRGQVWVQSLHEPSLDDDPLGDAFFVGYQDWLTPDTLMLGQAGRDGLQTLKQRPPLFDSAGMRSEQLFATSRDGTRVPYFVVWPRGARADGGNPTLLYGYGGFEVSMLPSYQSVRGRMWLARGGVLVIANIRGGGEFGPNWHKAAIREHKQRSYDDFIAVAEDLVARKITSPERLGIQGGSNGGLLMGAMLTQRPDLFRAVVCQVPLLDMRRYHKLLAGASWMAEYGDPDQPADWAFISKYSPYQQLRRDVHYPRVLFITSTRDDRVHPGHARKMVAKMQSLGHDVLYYENVEGGHGAAADAKQQAHLRALEFAYLWQQLGAGR